MTRPGVAVVASAVGVALLWLVLGTQAAPDPGSSGAHDWSGDFRSYYLPNAEYAGARWARGEIPLWNPHQGAGAPFLATLQVGALYPPNALHALLPAQTAFLVLAALHLLLAALLAGALAVALGAGAAGGALAGLAYAGSLQVVGGIWSPPVQYTAAWAPGLLLAVDRVAARPSVRRAVAFAGVLAVALLAGWPYNVAITALGVGVYALLVLVADGARSRRVPLGVLLALGFGALAGVVLAGPQLAPTAELVARSCRALGSLVEAQAIGGGVNRPHDPAVLLERLTTHGYSDAVPGVASLLLAALAVALPGPGRLRAAALLAAGAVGLLASFPHHTPLYGWLRELPVYGDFRFPFRYRLLPALALAVAAGVGLGHLKRALGSRPRVALAAGLGCIALQLVAVTIPTFSRLLPFARSWPPPVPIGEEIRDRGGLTALPKRDGRVYWADRAEKLRGAEAYDVVYDLEPLTLARTAELLTWFETGRPLTLLTLEPSAGAEARRGDHVAPPFFGKLVLPERGARARILDLFSVSTLVAETPPPWLERRYRRRSPHAAELAVFDNPKALPRVFRVVRALAEPKDLGVALATLNRRGFEPRRAVMLDAPPPELLLAPHEVPPDTSGRVEVLEDAPERLRLRSHGETPGIVVVTDAFYPGWEASLDGAPVAVLRANLGFRAVAVPAGTHEVEMRYRPASFWRATLLALGVLVLCAGLAWYDPSLRRRA